MTENEFRRINKADLFREFPVLENWFGNTQNITAQLFEGERLQSAWEKMNLFGGPQEVRKTLAREFFFRRRSTAALMACRGEPMTDYEIGIFEHKAGLKLNGSALQQTIETLLDGDLLGITGGLTFVIRSESPDEFLIIENKLGFLTTNIIWEGAKLPEEERDDEAERVAQLVQHPMIRSKRWVSPYQVFTWKMIENLPWKFSPAVMLAERVLQPRFDWEAEAFRIEQDTPEWTSLQLALRSRGSAPLNAPWLSRPTLKLDQVISPVLHPVLTKFPTKPRYREFLNLDLRVIFAHPPEGEGPGDIEPDQIPAYNQIIIKPFWFFSGQGENEKAVAEDPFRLIFHIFGAPLAYMREEIQRVNASLGGGEIRRGIFFKD